MVKILDGKQIAADITANLKQLVANLPTKPGLAVVLVGEDPSSKVYVNMKSIKCQELGFYSKQVIFPATVTAKELITAIQSLNIDKNIHGILVQMPLPTHLSTVDILSAVDPRKDVDGFHPEHLGRLLWGFPAVIPCTPKGIMRLIAATKVDLVGKRAVVVGRSNIVGKPVAQLLLNQNATVTQCHSHTQKLGQITREADVLVVAVGKPGLITADMVKEGAIVIDVGITKVAGKCRGDVDFENVKNKAAFISPVPCGVGPMTIAMLMENTYEAYLRSL